VRRERAASGFLSLLVRERVSWRGVRCRGLGPGGAGGAVVSGGMGVLVWGLASVVVRGAGSVRVIVGVGGDGGCLSGGGKADWAVEVDEAEAEAEVEGLGVSTVDTEMEFPRVLEGLSGSLDTRLVSLRLMFRVLLGSHVVRVELVEKSSSGERGGCIGGLTVESSCRSRDEEYLLPVEVVTVLSLCERVSE